MESADTALVLRSKAGDEAAPQALHSELQVDLVETRERLGIPDPDTPEPSPGIADLEYLKQLLREQAQAKVELQMQLTAVQAEVDKSRKQYHGAPRARETLTRAEAELAEARTQLHAAKKELDWEQRARRADSVQASTRIQKLEAELAATVSATVESQAKGHPKALRITLGAVAALALAAGIAAVAMNRQSPASVSAQEAAVETPAKASPDFTGSYNRLGQALAALPGRDAEDVLRQVQKSGGGCALRWNDGEPSLIFGRQGSNGARMPSSLESELTLCAEAVEKLR